MLKKNLSELTKEEKKAFFERSSSKSSSQALEIAKNIFEDVRNKGDDALRSYSRKFDGWSGGIAVGEEELNAALANLNPELRTALEESTERIRSFAEAQKPKETRRVTSCGAVKTTPVARAGVYVPGGTAAYPSSVLMTIIPARVAGVREIIACTPPNAGATVLAALALAGATRVFRVGGAQAIAAMALGTQSVPKCDKLFGPGNAFVNAAKTLAAAEGAAIDCPAGPSEILIISDGGAEARIVAADLLAQAEHDENACAVLVTTSEVLVEKVEAELEKQLDLLPRKKIAGEALVRNGALLLAENLDDAVAFANAYAPEHLELLVENPEALLEKIENAGAVFIGKWSCEAAGDYAAGPNHVLPTGGLARAFSGLSVESFMKQTTVTKLDEAGLRGLVKTIAAIARAEGLEGHARSAEERFK